MKNNKLLDDTFDISLILKALNGLLEIVGGISVLFITPERFQRFILNITQHELAQDPQDLVANYLRSISVQFTHSTEIFTSIFLISHGVIKLFLIYNLLKKKLWAYPTAIVVFILFIVYQLYRFGITHSIGLIILSVFDLFVVVLTALEYKKLKNI